MAIDHLVFNKLKWFNVADNADSVTANGRNFYALPSKIKVTGRGSEWGSNLSYDFTGKTLDVIGAFKDTDSSDNKKEYVVNYFDSGKNRILFFSERDCTPIW